MGSKYLDTSLDLNLNLIRHMNDEEAPKREFVEDLAHVHGKASVKEEVSSRTISIQELEFS
jgi:hypothetical protein